MAQGGMVYGWLKMDELRELVAVERLAQLENNKTKTAESLGITRTTLDKILADFEKRTAEDKSRIKTNNDKMNAILSQESKSWGHDVNTGMSTPLAPGPLPKIELFKPRPTSDDPLSKAAEAINNTPRIVNTFQPVAKPSPVIPVYSPLMTEAQREKERFDKLDKRPYSEQYPKVNTKGNGHDPKVVKNANAKNNKVTAIKLKKVKILGKRAIGFAK